MNEHRFTNALSTRLPYLSRTTQLVTHPDQRSLPPYLYNHTKERQLHSCENNLKKSFQNAFEFDVSVLKILNIHVGRSRQKTKQNKTTKNSETEYV